MSKQCADCRDGEHDNYDDDVRLVVVHETSESPQKTYGPVYVPAAKRIVRRAYMCGAHREMYAEDGYLITEK